MKRKLKTGDSVIVIAGNDRGKSGKIMGFSGEQRVVVEGVNIRKKHMKKTQSNQKGQIIDIERSIHISNVMPFLEEKGVKLRVKENKQGERQLYYRNESGKDVAVRPVKGKKG